MENQDTKLWTVTQRFLKKHIKQMMENGIIRKSKSPWASPIVMVTKPDGSIRFCVDYQALNKITKPDRYPLPRIDETIDKLRNMKYLSTLDLASGFWQIPMDERDREKTAFISFSIPRSGYLFFIGIHKDVSSIVL